MKDNDLSKFVRSDILAFIDRKPLRTIKYEGIDVEDVPEDDDRPEPLDLDGSVSYVGGSASISMFSGGGGGGGRGGRGGGGSSGGFSGIFKGDSRVKDQEAEQIVYVNYGHDGGGKVYTYRAKGAAKGKHVTAPVTHWRSGKNYKTLAIIREVKKSEDVGGEEGINQRRAEVGLKGISLKFIGPEDMNQYATTGRSNKGSEKRTLVFSPKSRLPGWKKYEKDASGQYRTHEQASRAWALDSKRRRDAKLKKRLGIK